VESVETYVYCPADGSLGNTTDEMFIVYNNALSPGAAILAGSKAVVKSVSLRACLTAARLADVSSGCFENVNKLCNGDAASCCSRVDAWQRGK
jgi:hypothetical protein